MARPLKLVGASPQELSDAEFDTVCFWLRRAFASDLDSGGTGAIFVGGTGTTIGSSADTSSTETLFSSGRNYTPGTDYPSTWPNTIGTETDATYTYKQNRTVPSAPTGAICDTQGFLIHDGATGLVTGVSDTDWSEILDETQSQIKTGDEIGSYRISTTSPGAGWVDKGTWFSDTTYSAGTTTYKLWLRTDDAGFTQTVPPSCFNASGASSSGIVQDTDTFSSGMGFVWNVLLPLLQRRVGNFHYSVSTGAGNRGSYTDTKQTAMTNDQYFSSPTYYNRTKPSGAAVTQTTYALELL